MAINWKKTIFVVCDIAIAAYLLLAITAFNKPESTTHCTEVKVDMEENAAISGFLNANEIKRLLTRERIYPLSWNIDDINVRKIEESLLKSPFVEKAECHKTQSGHVCIRVRQRIPVVRVMAENHDNYYVDTHGSIMPENRYAVNLIVATGAISRKYAQSSLTRVSSDILKNPFWKNQIVQINILSDGSVELVPRVGDHIIYLGPPLDVENKLERMRKFYLYGLNKAGWNKYNYISVEFNNQIICKKNKRKK